MSLRCTTPSVLNIDALPSNGSFTISSWYRFEATVPADASLWQIGTGGSPVTLSQDSGQLQLDDETMIAPIGFTPTADTWFYICVTRNGANYVAYWRNQSDISLSQSPEVGVTDLATGTPGFHFANVNGYYSNPVFDGQMAGFKIWEGVALAQDEVEIESHFFMPQRTGNLWAFVPFVESPIGSFADYGPNLHTLNLTSAAVETETPPINWQQSRRRVTYIASPTGFVSATQVGQVEAKGLPVTATTETGGVESLVSVANTQTGHAEILQISTQRIQTVYVESLGYIALNVWGEVDTLLGLIAQQEGQTESISSGMVVAYQNGEIESLAAAIKESTARVETLLGLQQLSTAQLESLLTVPGIDTGRVESLIAAVAEREIQVEATGVNFVAKTESGSVEVLTSVVAAETGSVETLQGLLQVTVGALETLQGLIQTALSNVESLDAVEATLTGQLEALVIPSKVGQVEVLVSVVSTMSGRLEALISVSQSEDGQLESKVSAVTSVADQIGRTESLQGIRGTGTGYVDVQSTNNFDQDITREIISPDSSSAFTVEDKRVRINT